MILPPSEEYAAEKVRHRIDPSRVRYWIHSQQQPRPFWLNPTTQTITRHHPSRDRGVWTYAPIHDPAWWTP